MEDGVGSSIVNFYTIQNVTHVGLTPTTLHGFCMEIPENRE